MLPEKFSGFQSGARATAIPNAFFSLVLPEISDPRELLVSVYAFFALGRQPGNPRSISAEDLASEQPLMRALSRFDCGAPAALGAGLAAALSRGTLLAVGRQTDGTLLYALSTDAARRTAAEAGLLAAAVADLTQMPATVAPNIYALYEQNIGSLAPLLVNELDEAEQEYPHPWIEAAFKEAVMNNRRSWRYISRILQRWKLEGPDYEASGGPTSSGAPGRRRAIGGPYRRIIER